MVFFSYIEWHFVSEILSDYLPVYFLACHLASPIRAGVDVFGVSQTTMPFGLLAGITVAKSGRYRPQLWFAWVLCIAGMSLFSTLDVDSGRAAQIGYQVIAGIGMGILLTNTVFPVLAEVEVTLNASALAFYMFARYMSQVRYHIVLYKRLGHLKRTPYRFGASRPEALFCRTNSRAAFL